MDLWRAVDHEREILDISVQLKRDKVEALKLMGKLLKKGSAQDLSLIVRRYHKPCVDAPDDARSVAPMLDEFATRERPAQPCFWSSL
ncbi:hypothetical protein JH26_02415 [Microvirga sp. BSC39]|nr:hypothetical protein JH26_02415 [Microvirga sp. BSC39]